MGIISRIFYLFAPYVDSRERAVGLFFKGLTEHSDRPKTRQRLDGLLQRNIAVINLYTEYRYKGYKYLKKRERRKLYTNLQLIATDFAAFRLTYSESADKVLTHINRIAPGAAVDGERALLLQSITAYLSPGRGLYEYRESSSFGRLLRDPAHEKLIGDCNQIVTLYIYLYSQYFAVDELKVRLLPGHVALHYGGVDIEATNGSFANYEGYEGEKLLPIEEIVSVNLLDTTDSYLKTHEVAPEDFLQASRFAYILSHDRDIVTHNLHAAYTMLISSLMKRNNYQQALKFARVSRDLELIAIVGHNGAIHELQQHRYESARKFAGFAPERTELIRESYRAEGSHFYENHRYHDAIRAFHHLGDQSLVRQCYEALFFDEQRKLPANLTAETVKAHAAAVKRMRNYAKKSANKSLVLHVENLYKYL